MRMHEESGPKKLDPLGLRAGTSRSIPENALSLSSFRNSIFHYGVSRTLERLESEGRTFEELARGFEATHDWGEDPEAVVNLFAGLLSKLKELGDLIEEEPSLPEPKKNIFAFSLVLCPVNENYWDEVAWPSTSDVTSFSMEVARRTKLLSECELVLPQGGYYIPAHFMLDIGDKNHEVLSDNFALIRDAAIEMFLVTVSAERAYHVVTNGYSLFGTRETRAKSRFREGRHQIYIRTPALSADFKTQRLLSAGLELYDCLNAKDPEKKANDILAAIEGVVSRFTCGEHTRLCSLLRRSYTDETSDMYPKLSEAISKELDFL